MANAGSVNVDFNANMRNFNRAIDRASRRLDAFGNDATRSQRTVGTSTVAIGNAYAQMAQFAVRAITKVIDKTVEWSIVSSKMAIDMESSMHRLERVFGTSSDVMVGFMNDQARALGLSQLQAARYSGQFGNLLKNMGSGSAVTAEYTKQLLTLAGVIKSQESRFTMEEVLFKLRSGILGNIQAIDDLGIEAKIGMIETTNAFKKLADGKTWEQLNDNFPLQQKIRLMAILEQGTNLYGTTLQDTVSTKLTMFNAILDDASLKLGQAFLPLIERALPHLIDLANGLEFVLGKLARFSDLLFGVRKTSEKAADGQKKIADGIKKSGDAAKKSLGSFDELNTLQEKIASTGQAQQTETQAGGAGKEDFIGPPLPPTEFEQRILDLREALSGLNKAFKELSDTTKPIWEPITTGMTKIFGDHVSQLIKGATKDIERFTETTENVSKGVDILSGMFGYLTDAENWSIFWEEVKTMAAENAPKSLEGASKKISEGMDSLWKGIEGSTGTWWGKISERVSKTMIEINNLKWDDIRKTVSDMWEALRKDDTNKWMWEIKNRVSMTLDEIAGEGTAALVWSKISDTVSNMWEGLTAKTGTIWDTMKTVVFDAIQDIIDGINNMFRKIESTASSVGVRVNLPTIPDIQRPESTNTSELIKSFNQLPPTAESYGQKEAYDFTKQPNEQGREITFNFPIAIDGAIVGQAAVRYNEQTGEAIMEGSGTNGF